MNPADDAMLNDDVATDDAMLNDDVALEEDADMEEAEEMASDESDEF